jgi:putative adhesin
MRALLGIAVLALSAAPPPPAADNFQWHGSIGPGHSIEIKGVNGDVRAEPSGSNEVEVVAEKTANRDNPDSVRIEVVPHDGDVTICAVYPSRDSSRPNECLPGTAGHMSTQNNDVQVRFTVRVPARVVFVGRTVNGGLDASRLNGDLVLATVNGSVTFSTTGEARATTVNGSIKGEMGQAMWSGTLEMNTVNGGITLALPQDLNSDVKLTTVNGDIQSDFPVTVSGTMTRRKLEGTIGGGGRLLALSTTNGSVTLKTAR